MSLRVLACQSWLNTTGALIRWDHLLLLLLSLSMLLLHLCLPLFLLLLLELVVGILHCCSWVSTTRQLDEAYILFLVCCCLFLLCAHCLLHLLLLVFHLFLPPCLGLAHPLILPLHRSPSLPLFSTSFCALLFTSCSTREGNGAQRVLSSPAEGACLGHNINLSFPITGLVFLRVGDNARRLPGLLSQGSPASLFPHPKHPCHHPRAHINPDEPVLLITVLAAAAGGHRRGHQGHSCSSLGCCAAAWAWFRCTDNPTDKPGKRREAAAQVLHQA